MEYPAPVNALPHSLRARAGRRFGISVLLLALSLVPASGRAAIRFQDVSTDAGILTHGPTYGASWGDVDGDGWPDIWVGNHNTKPTLYRNGQDGTFEDVIDRVWSADPKADTHGAAWADFDNDGDQDLVEVVAASENPDGTFCLGCGKNHLFVNENGKLVERAADFGLDQTGNARSPLWLDANRDGLLDLLVVNTSGPQSAASQLYIQDKSTRFPPAAASLGFTDAPWSRSERIWARVENGLRLSFRGLPQFNSQRNLEFAQLAGLTADGPSDLLLLTLPTRVFDMRQVPFENVSNRVGLPDRSGIKDVAIADFNGDSRMDMVVTEGTWLASHVIQPGAAELKGMITWSGGRDPKGVRFRCTGDVEFQIHPTWLPLSKVFIGAGGRHPDTRRFTLSPNDAGVAGTVDDTASGIDGVTIGVDPATGTWTVRNAQRSVFVDFIAAATADITDVQLIGFTRYEADGRCLLFLMQADGTFGAAPLGEGGEKAACISLVAGDFDNDMDVDIYMVRTGPIMNFPNRLLENNGRGGFVVVPDAGGAAGTDVGRGDVGIAADYDQDGFLDLFVTNGSDPTSPFVADAPHQLFRNQGNANHWLEIDLQGVVSNRDAIGARVEVVAGGVTQVRDQTGGMHRWAQHHQRLHFGLAANERVDRVTVTWPSGLVQHLADIPADQILRLTEPSGEKK